MIHDFWIFGNEELLQNELAWDATFPPILSVRRNIFYVETAKARGITDS